MPRSSVVVRLGNALPSKMAARIGSSYTAKHLLRPLANLALPDEFVPVVVRSGPASGLEIEIDPKTEKLFWHGVQEPVVQETLVTFLRPGDAFWDVGAHAGFFTLLAARRVGPTGVVHAFEPNEATRTRLISGIARNGFTNVIVHPEALSGNVGWVEFNADTISTISKIGTVVSSSHPFAVPTTTLDRMLEAGTASPRLIKLDTEGAEPDILRGAPTLLANQTTAWLVEVHEPGHRQPILDTFESFDLQWLDHRHVFARPQSIAGSPITGQGTMERA